MRPGGFDATARFRVLSQPPHTEVTTRPEFWWDGRSLNKINEFVHCIAALEHILLPAREDTRRNEAHPDVRRTRCSIHQPLRMMTFRREPDSFRRYTDSAVDSCMVTWNYRARGGGLEIVEWGRGCSAT